MFKITASLVRNTFSSFKPIRLLHTPRFLFATGPRSNSTNKQNPPKPALREQVENEINYEMENIPDDSESINALKNDNWTLNSKGLYHELNKQMGDKTVTVTFFSRPPSATPETEANQQEEEEQMPEYFEFTVYVKKGSNAEALYADFIVSEGEVTVGGLSFTGDYQSHKTMSKLERPSHMYHGPDLDTLDEALVNSITEYFEGLGVNESVINFIENYSISSEHQFYVKWLNQLKEYV